MKKLTPVTTDIPLAHPALGSGVYVLQVSAKDWKFQGSQLVRQQQFLTFPQGDYKITFNVLVLTISLQIYTINWDLLANGSKKFWIIQKFFVNLQKKGKQGILYQ